MMLQIVYLANMIVAGWIGVTSLFQPHYSASTVFSNAYAATDTIRLAGAWWLAIAILSFFGLWKPITFSPILLAQLLYKGIWLLFVALPAVQKNQPIPTGMAWFFIVWVVILPFVIPWKAWMNG